MAALTPKVTVVTVNSKHSGYSCLDCSYTSANPFEVDRHVLDMGHTVTYTLTEVREVRKVTA
jgi:hypothetical protein